MSFVQIADFDELPWQPKGYMFEKKYSKIFFSEAIRGMKLKLCINAMSALSFHILIMGKVEIGIYFCFTADILTKVLLKCFWSSPLPTI